MPVGAAGVGGIAQTHVPVVWVHQVRPVAARIPPRIEHLLRARLPGSDILANARSLIARRADATLECRAIVGIGMAEEIQPCHTLAVLLRGFIQVVVQRQWGKPCRAAPLVHQPQNFLRRGWRGGKLHG